MSPRTSAKKPGDGVGAHGYGVVVVQCGCGAVLPAEDGPATLLVTPDSQLRGALHEWSAEVWRAWQPYHDLVQQWTDVLLPTRDR